MTAISDSISALDGAGFTSLEMHARQCETDVAALHEMGPSVGLAKRHHEKQSLNFAQPTS